MLLTVFNFKLVVVVALALMTLSSARPSVRRNSGAQQYPVAPDVFKAVTVGTMNVQSLSADIATTCRNIPTDLQVLTLQEVWLDSHEEAVKSLLGKDYPYQYTVPKRQVVGGCRNTSAILVDALDQCLAKHGVKYVSYFTVMPCLDLLLRIMDEDYDCAECYLAVAVDSNKQPKERCMANQGYKYVFGGSTAMMVLSKSPIYFASFEDYPSFMRRQGMLTFCVDGVLYGTSHWLFNWTYTTETGHKGWVSVNQYSQADMAVKVLTKRPSIFMGDLNSGPGYQEEGYNILMEEGYEDVAPGLTTFCPDPAAPQCLHEQEKQLPLDHIFVDAETSRHQLVWQDRNYHPSTFVAPPNQTSDHVGLRAQVSFMKVREHPYCRLPPRMAHPR